jgi:hypothetical protein
MIPVVLKPDVNISLSTAMILMLVPTIIVLLLVDVDGKR